MRPKHCTTQTPQSLTKDLTFSIRQLHTAPYRNEQYLTPAWPGGNNSVSLLTPLCPGFTFLSATIVDKHTDELTGRKLFPLSSQMNRLAWSTGKARG